MLTCNPTQRKHQPVTSLREKETNNTTCDFEIGEKREKQCGNT